MESNIGFPDTRDKVLEIIVAAERHRRFVWTAGRVLREGALRRSLSEASPESRKRILKCITLLLQELAEDGILQRRDVRQSIGYGNEIGFDYVVKRGAAIK